MERGEWGGKKKGGKGEEGEMMGGSQRRGEVDRKGKGRRGREGGSSKKEKPESDVEVIR